MKDSIRIFARTFCVVFVCVALSSAYSPNSNPVGEVVNQALGDGPELPFDPNDYMFLVYESPSSENRILQAMAKIEVGPSNLTVCDRNNPVTANLLANHDILIVGWSVGGDKSGLVASVIGQGITGRVILSGHDSDYHTVYGPDYAETFFIQEIDYILQGSGTGMIVCADVDNNFDWLPESWGIESDVGGGANISSFTQAGLDSGIFDGLTPDDMSNWSTSYHNTFEEWGDGFREFELGNGDEEVVTIAAAINPYGFIFEKTDDVNDFDCLSPGDEITYTICWDNTSLYTFDDVWIIDYLPDDVIFPGGFPTFDPNDLAYDPNTYTYIWELGTGV